MKFLNRKTTKECELLLSRKKLQNEQSGLSVMNDFAKYSKVQRKINAVDQELQEIRTTKISSNFIFTNGFKYGLKVFFHILLIFLTIYYHKSPVFVLDDKYDFFPFTNLISYPNKEINAVSVHFWIISNTYVFKLVNLSKILT